MRNVPPRIVLDRHSERRQPETLGNKNELARTETSNSGVRFPCRVEPISLAGKSCTRHVKVGDSTRDDTPLCVWRLYPPMV